ncbi:ChaN family lipoprotein [Fulvivirgaceae bacterium BMA12]|uniref:ChaN family lipoprotein n=1 Tax=Agaribacillus aureus TaxID=3051825 RepID=A0ABT8L8U0_9BACT|nr:ChaN family lipoprotein [Fulvivirgaceae bacterium BMA12]
MKFIDSSTVLKSGIALMLVLLGSFDTKDSYRLYDRQGKHSNYRQLLDKAVKADVVLFGELHDNPICHWLQLELTRDLYDKKSGKVILGAEMFEADNQMILDEFLDGLIGEANFEKEAKLWNNYRTDYKPLVLFAKEKHIPFIASNIPRRYASMVYKGGFASLQNLSARAKSFIAPLPIAYDSTLEGYSNMLAMAIGHGGSNLPRAQAIKDATMAHFIYRNLEKRHTLIHLNGTYHSNNFEGIGWYLNQLDDRLKILSIASVEQSDVNVLVPENEGVADFILTIPSTMTKTH